ncbi:MAG: hypothetical protein HWN68_02450 [Desulfobacterales bacterium]|nr:hypothetical protein [Desulfobacterales bacterium]
MATRLSGGPPHGTPIAVPPKAGGETQEVYRAMLEEEINRITRAVDQCYGHTTD